MKRMNRRDFMTVIGGVGAASLAGIQPLFAAGNTPTTTMYLQGLIMLSFEDDKNLLQIGFPKAPGHKATLSVVPINGTQRTIAIKGNGQLETKVVSTSKPKVTAPELVRIKELYGDGVVSKIDNCPSVFSIPYSAIQSISTDQVTKDRYTFVRTDTGAEIESFRPRQLAESLKIELSSAGTLKLENGKVSIPLGSTRELRTNFAPDLADRHPDMYSEHFENYFDYIERPPAANFMVMPKKVGGSAETSTPKIGSHFMMVYPDPMCYMLALGLGFGSL
jgi:hypothetical protein